MALVRLFFVPSLLEQISRRVQRKNVKTYKNLSYVKLIKNKSKERIKVNH